MPPRFPPMSYWGLRRLMLGWLMPFFLLAAGGGVIFNYALARQGSERLVREYIQQRRMDLQFVANLPTMGMYVMDLRLGLHQEAAFFRQELERSLMRYLEQASVTPPYRLSLLSMDGEALLDFRDGRPVSDPADLPWNPPSHLWSQKVQAAQEAQEVQGQPDLPSLMLAGPFSRQPEGTLADYLPLVGSIHHDPIGVLVFEYQVPLGQLLGAEQRILRFNIGWSILGLSVLFGIFYLIVDYHIRPLRQLTGAVGGMIEGRLDRPIPLAGHGETRVLAASFETLRQRLWESFEEIQRRNQDLAALLQEQQAVSNQLRETTFRFDQLAEQSRTFVWEVDAQGRYTSVSPVVEEVTGHRPEELVGKRFVEVCPEGERAEYLEIFDRAVNHGHRLFMPLKSILARNGTEVWVNSSGVPLLDDRARIYGFHGRDSDITERVLAEREKEQLQSQLLHAQKMEAIGTMAGGVAHDFNNLLQVMNGYAQLLLTRKAPDDPDRNALEQINNSGKRAASLVHQLLTFSRKLESRPLPMDLNQEILETEKMWRQTFRRMIQVETTLADPLQPINADPIQIQQILLNLVGNAADAMPDGGVLRLSTENVPGDALPDELSGELSGEQKQGDTPRSYVLLRVADTGCGMDRETRERIFDPFFTTKEVGKGTGLGLASVYGIVSSYNGLIQCRSEPGQGTTFMLYFPAADGVQAPSPGKTESTSAGGVETILVVDDEPEILELTREVLEGAGYSVVGAGSGEEALRIYQEQPSAVDMIILDLNMPGMGGRRCLSALLAHDPRAKVLIASGFSAQGNATELLDQGATGFIGKPYRMQELLDEVRRVLDNALDNALDNDGNAA